jgi:hypothetical protein
MRGYGLMPVGGFLLRVWRQYSDFPEICGMIRATKAEDILERPVADRPPIYCWGFGRVLLIGDAVRIWLEGTRPEALG